MESQSNNISPQQQQEVLRLQQLQKSVEVVIQQRVSMESQLKELEFAVSEVENAEENAVIFTASGGIFIKKPRNEVLTSTKDRKTKLEMRVKTLTMQETRLKEQFEEQRKKLQATLSPNR